MFSFLRDLQSNNSKEWMDSNRKEYESVRDWYISWLNDLDVELGKVDPNYNSTNGKRAINRINNNLLYHPNKPIYKDHFGAGMDLSTNGKQGDFYIHIGLNGSFLAGGYWHPQKKILDSLRDAIDYNGADFKKILNNKSFKETFGEMVEDENSLKTSPKGYSQDHEHIELLRRKSFAVRHDITQKEIMQDDFKEKCVKIYKEMLPFRKYLNKAVTV